MLFMWQAAGVAPRTGGLVGAAGVRGVVAGVAIAALAVRNGVSRAAAVATVALATTTPEIVLPFFVRWADGLLLLPRAPFVAPPTDELVAAVYVRRGIVGAAADFCLFRRCRRPGRRAGRFFVQRRAVRRRRRAHSRLSPRRLAAPARHGRIWRLGAGRRRLPRLSTLHLPRG